MTERHWIPGKKRVITGALGLKRHGVSGETLTAAGSSSGPGGATVSARDIDRIAYLPAAAAEHPPSA